MAGGDGGLGIFFVMHYCDAQVSSYLSRGKLGKGYGTKDDGFHIKAIIGCVHIALFS